MKDVKVGEEVIIDAELRLNGVLSVSGKLIINKRLDSNFYDDRYVIASDSASVRAWGSASVRASDSYTYMFPTAIGK